MVSEKKLDKSFPVGQFLIEGYGVPYRVEQSANGGWIMLFVRKGILSKLVSRKNAPTEAFLLR